MAGNKRQKILILGANGYLGARLFFDLRKKFEVIGTYNRNQFYKDFIHLDVIDAKQIRQVFDQLKPDVIIQTANYPSPRHAVNNEEAYRKLNLQSTQYIVDEANKVGARVIFISSFAALNPNDIYGELKLKSENIMKQVKAGWLILRPSLILGFSPNTENDRPFNRVLKCLKQPDLAQFDTSWEFQPTYIGHISQIIVTAIEHDIFNHLVHVFCPSIETQFSTARDILKPFDVVVQPIDKKMQMPIQKKDEKELTKLGLPTCSYQAMIEAIQQEIKNKEKFIL